MLSSVPFLSKFSSLRPRPSAFNYLSDTSHHQLLSLVGSRGSVPHEATLGYLGLHDFEQARTYLERVLALDCNHQGAQVHLTMLS
jgi:hypothetical protein